MRELVPIKVRIGLLPNNFHDYPQWYTLPMFDILGSDQRTREEAAAAHMPYGWHYDNIGHREETPDSPWGIQWGMLLVTDELAQQALAKWPDHIVRLTDAEARTFWETRCYAHIPEIDYDTSVLTGLHAARELLRGKAGSTAQTRLAALEQQIDNALDPDHPEPGVRRSPHPKHWDAAKVKFGFRVKA